RRLSGHELAESLLVLRFENAQIEELRKAYEEAASELRALLSHQGDCHLPHYASLDWRLDIVLGTRSLRNLAQPLFFLDLQLLDGRPETNPTGNKDEQKEQEENSAGRERVLLQADVVNLRHLTAELEAAVATIKQPYARRVDR